MRKHLVTKMVFVLALVLAMSSMVSAAIDMGGVTVSIVDTSDRVEGLINSGRLAEAEELFNVKIVPQVLPYEDYVSSLIARLMSGDSEYDIWFVTQGEPWFHQLVGQSALFPVSDVLGTEVYGDALIYNKTVLDEFTIAGTMYSAGYAEPLWGGGAAVWVAWNKDLFEAEGLPSPYELYENGEWDWDSFRDIAIAATKDFDGDGETDQWGIANMSVWAQPVISNGATLVAKDEETGKLLYNWNSEPVLEAIRFGSELVNVHKVTTSKANFEQGKAAMIFAAAWEMDIWAREGTVNYGVVPLPMGPSADDHTLYQGWSVTTVLPANAAAPEALVQLSNFLYGPSDGDWKSFIERETEILANNIALDPVAAEIIIKEGRKFATNGKVMTYTLTPTAVWNAYVEARDGIRTPAEAMNAVAQEGQAYIDSILQQ